MIIKFVKTIFLSIVLANLMPTFILTQKEEPIEVNPKQALQAQQL